MEYLDIINHIALQFSLVVFCIFIFKHWQKQTYFKNIFFGIVFGMITVLGMTTPFVFSEGLILDARSVILGLSGLFGGPTAALISSTMAAGYRLEIGGIGTVPGLISIYIAGLIGVTGYYLYKRQAKLTDLKLLLLGFIIHCCVVLAMFTLPDDIQIKIIKTMAFPYFIIFPVIFWLLGKLLLVIEEEVAHRQQLKESQERLHYALEGSENGVWDWNMSDNKFYYTQQWKSILGYEKDEIGNTYETWYNLIHPDDLQKVLDDIEAHVSGKTKYYENEHRLRHKNGSWISILARGKIVDYDNKDRPLRMVGTHTDITELKEQTFLNQQLKELYNSIIDSIDNMVFVKDKTFTYIACNTAFTKFLDKPKEKIIGYTDYDLFDKHVADFFREKDQQMFQNNKAQSNFEWVTYPDGREAYLLTVKSPLVDKHHNIIGLVGNSVEVTEQK